MLLYIYIYIYRYRYTFTNAFVNAYIYIYICIYITNIYTFKRKNHEVIRKLFYPEKLKKYQI